MNGKSRADSWDWMGVLVGEFTRERMMTEKSW